jgi:hypothetical protein
MFARVWPTTPQICKSPADPRVVNEQATMAHKENTECAFGTVEGLIRMVTIIGLCSEERNDWIALVLFRCSSSRSR